MSIEERLTHLEMLIICSTKEVLTTDECAMYLKVTSDWVRQMARNRQIPCYKHAGKYYFKRKELEDMVTSERHETQEELDMISKRRMATKTC